ncbi:family 16 glycosylhydrolase [Pelagibius marinus]|uniref:family 16 glycosylhydrolase n=1 Tax=Pelagibius marinus TaxID=2762760 RepID=UPI0018731215|nr:family 16 glycosylhydrolase [Pelagibius marinus]
MSIVINARGVPLSHSAASLYHFSATDAGPLLEGTGSHDSFWGDSRVTVTLLGGAGDDIYHLYSTGNRAREEPGEGIDTVVTWMDYRLPANIENLTVTGSYRHAFGNALDNIITGGDGRQTLDGRGGDDVLIGGAGSDVFSVTAGNGSDLIVDFSGEDVLRLFGTGFTAFDEVAARFTQQGDDAVLDLGGGEILVLADTAVADIAADQVALEIDLSGLTETFSEDFDSLSLWDGQDGIWESNFWWGAENGSALDSQLNWYIDTDYAATRAADPFSIDAGVLTITAAETPEELKAEVEGHAYTSGLLTTYNSFAQTYGYFEIRADMPEGKGLWPAFWLLPADGNWPPELDVIETIGQDPERLILTAHSQADGTHDIETHYAEVADTEGFHRYGLLWTEEELVWTYDGVEVARGETPADLHAPMYLLVNLGVGGIAGAPGAALEEGAEMKVDYIRAYALDGPANPGDDTLTGSSGADTLRGGAGDDDLRALAGDDLLFGGSGDDSLNGGAGFDSLDGGSGSDTVDYAAARLALSVDLLQETAVFGGGLEVLVSIENVRGGSGADTLSGGNGANALYGGAGGDNLNGRGGDDLLDGGWGADFFFFSGLDLPGGDGQDTIAGFESGQDRLGFADVTDADGDGDRDLDDLLAAVSEVTDGGAGGDVVVSFGNGASITFAGLGSGAVETLTDLVDDPAGQLRVC